MNQTLSNEKPATFPEFYHVSLEAERAEIERIAKRLRDAAANGRRGLAAMSQGKHTEQFRGEFGNKLADYDRLAAALDIDGHAVRVERTKFLNRVVGVLLLALAGVGLGWASEEGETARLSRLLDAMPEVCKRMASEDREP